MAADFSGDLSQRERFDYGLHLFINNLASNQKVSRLEAIRRMQSALHALENQAAMEQLTEYKP
jgi:hypothetical protein